MSISRCLIILSSNITLYSSKVRLFFHRVQDCPAHPTPQCQRESDCLPSVNHRDQCEASWTIKKAALVSVQRFFISVSGSQRAASKSMLHTVMNTQQHTADERSYSVYSGTVSFRQGECYTHNKYI